MISKSTEIIRHRQKCNTIYHLINKKSSLEDISEV
jgi:hypothetical protein